MTKESAVEAVVRTIHQALEQAEFALAKLEGPVQFLVGHDGVIEIVRRSRFGGPVRPKVVIAELKGCDPLLWRPEPAGWLSFTSALMEAEPLLELPGEDVAGRSDDTGDGDENGQEI